MANEPAVEVQLSGINAKSYTCAAGTDILKGTLLKLSGDNTVSASDGANVYAGTAAADKDGDDSSTTLAVHVPGALNKFDMECGTVGVTLGSLVSLEGANTIKDAVAAEILTGGVIGRAQEAGAAGEVVVVLS